MKVKLLIIGICLILLGCSTAPTAQQIIDKSIENYGGEAAYNSTITFKFRDKNYSSNYQNGNYQLERTFKDSLGVYKDVLTNNGFKRMINDSVVELTEEWKHKYSNSINSVIYFFRIPFHLNDEAINKEIIGKATIDNQEYYKIKVWFNQEGGGEDFSDVFVYWINKTNYNIDYFAYRYETDGGGKRFRKMVYPRRVNNLLVVDYINYKPKDKTVSIAEFDTYFQNDGMEKLSEIINEDVQVISN
jgi:Family of unknown function (DUF6503)